MTTSLRRFLKLLLLTLFVSSFALSALADPPGRAVRIKYISGAVSMQPGGVNDWVEAVVNRPLTTSDRVWTDKEARAELHLGSAALRMLQGQTDVVEPLEQAVTHEIVDLKFG